VNHQAAKGVRSRRETIETPHGNWTPNTITRACRWLTED
jgi:hypothetical protein